MNTLTYEPSDLIEKENINSLTFPSEEVLTNKSQKASRASKLARAVKLGNLEKHKVRIDFKDASSIKRVQTTIWSVTEYFAILKSHTRIPVNRILDVNFL